jgi:prepilin-type N-terminal cleavage/methylation domain-containing protein
MLSIYKNKHGFTVVELLIVIVVIVLLATLGFAGYRGAQSRAYHTEAMNDAENIADKLEIAYLDNKKYPLDLAELGDLKKSPSTSVTYVSNGESYCLQVSSTNSSAKTYTLRDDKNIVEGTCAGWVPSSGVATLDSPVATISSVTTSSFSVNWAAVSGATGYIVKYGTASPTTTASCSASPCSINGLALDTTYYVTVTATNAGLSTTSAVVTTRTLAPLPTAPSISYVGPQTRTASGKTYDKYTFTASATCPIGTIEWRMTTGGNGSPSWSGIPWTTSASISEEQQRIFSSGVRVYVYAQPRCVSGSAVGEYNGYASGYVDYPGTGGTGGSKTCDPAACPVTF